MTAFRLAAETFEQSALPVVDRLEAFPRFASKRSVARFLAKYEIYQRITNVNGVVIECGVLNGAGLFSWAQFTNIFEPANHTRRIIGFDTFAGFPTVSGPDQPAAGRSWRPGDLTGSSKAELERSIEKHDAERHLSHIPRIELVEGDFTVTCQQYLASHPHLLVALLYLDFDLYEPTRHALEHFLPRMAKGSIVCFDELNCESFPGETQAFLECEGLRGRRLERFPTDPWISFVEL